MRKTPQILLLLILLFTSLTAFADDDIEEQDRSTYNQENKMKDWTDFIKMKRESGKLRPMYLNVMEKHFKDSEGKGLRAANFGSGAAHEDIDLLKKGWEVLSIDLNPTTHQILSEQSKDIKGKSVSFEGRFEEAKLDGRYDLIFSINSLPFGSKDKLDIILKNISTHLNQNGGIFAANLFGKDHGFVNEGIAYSVTEEELRQKLRYNGLQIIAFQEVHKENYKTSEGEILTWHSFVFEVRK